MEPLFLSVQNRTAFGKKLGALRRAGITPLHVYGRGVESLSLQVETGPLIHTLARVGRTTPFTLQVDGSEHFVIVRDVQLHPVTDRLLHIDLLQVSRTERMTVEVPVHLVGEAPAAREPGAMLLHDLYAVEVEGLPMELPSELTIDVSSLTEPDMTIHARDISLPQGVSLVTHPDTMVTRIGFQRGMAEPEEAEGVAPSEVPPEEQDEAEEK